MELQGYNMKKFLILFLVLITSVSFGQTRPHWLQIKETPAIDVRSYGAKGDGITDDTDEIQAALDTKQPVLIPSGTFLISKPLKIYANQTITGIDPASSVLKAATDTLMIRFGTPGVITAGGSVKNIALNRANVTASNWHIHMINPLLCVVDNVRITGYPSSTVSGVAFDNGSGGLAMSGAFVNHIRNTLVNHGSVLIGTTDSTVRECEIWAGENSALAVLPYAIQIIAANVYVQNNFIVPASALTGTAVGVQISNTSFVFIQNNYFDGSYSYVKSGYAIDARTCSYVNISGNHFWNIYRGGVNLNNAFRVQICNNIFYHCNRADSVWHDVVVETTGVSGSTLIDVSHNMFDRPTDTLATNSYPVYVNDLGSGTSVVDFRFNQITGRYAFYETPRGSNAGNTWGTQLQEHQAVILVATGTTSTFVVTPTFRRAPTLAEISLAVDDKGSGTTMRVTDLSSSSITLTHPVPTATTTVGINIEFK
jgi:hypothetical protein